LTNVTAAVEYLTRAMVDMSANIKRALACFVREHRNMSSPVFRDAERHRRSTKRSEVIRQGRSIQTFRAIQDLRIRSIAIR